MNPICPYCGKISTYTDSKIVYSRSYGMIYICHPCDAYVGVHKGTDQPLGRLANKELREAKILAHYYFDQLWKRKIVQGFSKTKARNLAYIWLSIEMNMDVKDTHIGMFDEVQCQKVVEICKKYCK